MMRKHLKPVLKLWPLYLFLAAYLTYALFTFADFGISSIEPDYYSHSEHLADYLLGRQGEIINLDQRETPDNYQKYYAYGAFLSLLNPTGSYEYYHLLNLIFASLAFIFAYVVVYQKYHDKYLALIAPLFIFFSARFTGHLAINPVDMSFAVLFFVSLCILYLSNHFSDKLFNSIFFKSLLLGILFGLTTSLNFFGFILYFLYLVQVLHNLFIRFQGSKWQSKFAFIKYGLLELTMILIIAGLTMLLTWPYVGSNFLGHFTQLWQNFFNPKGAGSLVFYLGEFQSTLNLPWHYLFTWFFVTTPVIVLLLFILSLIFTFKKISDDLYVLNTSAIVLILLGYIYIKIPDLQGMRQYLFLVPLICLNAALFIVELVYKTKNKLWKQLLAFILLLSFANTAYTMFELHPYQYLYFNEPAENLHETSGLLPMDYLKTTNKEASLWIINDITNNNLVDPYLYTCEERTSYQYFGKGTFTVTNDTEVADYLVCPGLMFEIEPTYQLVRKGIVLNNITKVYHEY